MGWMSSIIGAMGGAGNAAGAGQITGGGFDWGSLLNTAVNAYGAYQGSKAPSGAAAGSGTGGTSNIWGSLLSGLGGAAEGYLSGKDLEESIKQKGKQDRTTIDFEYGLKDFYTQKDKVRKRAALDTYGQFSLTDRFAPGIKPAPPVEQPAKPGVG